MERNKMENQTKEENAEMDLGAILGPYELVGSVCVCVCVCMGGGGERERERQREREKQR
jgi:hypothetical protein